MIKKGDSIIFTGKHLAVILENWRLFCLLAKVEYVGNR